MNDKHCDENVDMEAIFKSVLEDANRGLPEEGTPEQNVECTVSATMESPKLAINQMQWNPMVSRHSLCFQETISRSARRFTYHTVKWCLIIISLSK